MLVLPGLILFGLFGVFPVGMSLLGTVIDFGPYGDGWIGFKPYVDVFTNPRFWASVWVTLRFTLILLPTSMILTVVMGIILSWASSRVQSVLRAAFFIPGVVSAMMISFAWRWLVAPGGPLKWLVGDTLLLASNPYAFWTICVVVLATGAGGALIYFAAAMSAVDSELYDAARLDGCTSVQEAWHITLPLIMPILTYITIIRTSGLLQIWQFPYAMTGGGPNYATTTLMLNIYQTGLASYRIPQGAVMSLFLLVLTIGIVLLYRLSGRKILF